MKCQNNFCRKNSGKTDFSCSFKNRCIFSTICTALAVILIFFLPIWNFKLSGDGIKKSSEKALSVSSVSLVAKPKEKQHANEKPQVMPQKVKQEAAKKNETIPKPTETKALKTADIEATQNEEPEKEVSDTATQNTEALQNSQAENADSTAVSSGEEILNPVQKKLLADYKAYALSRIASKKVYPVSARSKGLEGKVRAQLEIAPDGSVNQVKILSPSEYEILNEATLQAIKKSVPFKKMSFGARPLTLTFVMDYSLK